MSKSSSGPPEKVVSFAGQEVKFFKFDSLQSNQLHVLSECLARLGGPQAVGVKTKALTAARELKRTFSKEQRELLEAYADGLVSLLIFEGMQKITDMGPPDDLPDLRYLERRRDVIYLASRNQLLLKLVDNESFAYDIDNEGKLTRLVANFKGGGKNKLNAEPQSAELSSHSGLALGPHTEAPYWCAMHARDGHTQPSIKVLALPHPMDMHLRRSRQLLSITLVLCTVAILSKTTGAY